MDDRELEGRLRTHLHQRFDVAPVPAGLAAAVRDGLVAGPATKVGYTFRARALQLGWAATAAIVMAVGGFLLFSTRLGPASPLVSPSPPGQETPSPAPTAAPDRIFVVMPPLLGEPGRELSNRVSDQLGARIMALGAPSLGSAVEFGIVFAVPPEQIDQPTDDEIRDVLRAVGDVQFVPLPASDYGNDKLQVELGRPLPKAEPPLFGWEGVDSVGRRGTYFEPNAVVTLKGAAVDAFAAYTTNHAGGQFAIVIDGIVGIAPRINEPILNGEIELATGLEHTSLFRHTVAILAAGKLVDGWSTPTVPLILDRASAVLAAQRQAQEAGAVASTDVEVMQDGARWRAVWRVLFTGGAVVTIDAVTGEWLSTGIS